ncbi:hemerythrin family protein [Candidatus Ventrimonas sp. KK005]|nr:hemerythrin family protein [Lachnospiraceae bacterium]NBH17314.1 hemerythrin [Clostridiaceae bacterium]
MTYTWSKDLETGNHMIDQQHKQLVQCINDLMNACSQGKGRDQIIETMQFLQTYTAKHFGDEEILQQRYKYPDYINHKKYHETFKKTVADILAELKSTGPTVALVAKVNTSIGSWFINHIKREDIKVAKHIISAS